MPSYHYKYTYKYTKSTVIDEEPHHVRHHDDDSIRRLRKRHSSPSARVEKSTSRSNESLRPLWVIVNKIDNHYGSESGRHRHRDNEREHDRHHSHGHRSRSSRYSAYSDDGPEYLRTRQNGSGPPSPSRPRLAQPSPPPSSRRKLHSPVGLDMSSSVPSYVDVGTSTLDYWYCPTQVIMEPNHQTSLTPPPPYTSTEPLYAYGPSMFDVPVCELTYCSCPAESGCVQSGHSHGPCVTVPMVMCAACCQASVRQGYPCIRELYI